MNSFEIIPFGVEEAKLYGALAPLVRTAGRNPRPRRMDLQIAATAAAAHVPLLTTNIDDFVGLERLVTAYPVKRRPAPQAPAKRPDGRAKADQKCFVSSLSEASSMTAGSSMSACSCSHMAGCGT